MPGNTEGFLNQIVVMLPAFQAVEERLDRETGRRFSALNLFTPDEPATSRLLEFLLNPMGAHGQRDLFLRLFINRFVPEWRDTFASHRAHPASTAERIDITISDNDRWIGIENKIFRAPEQNRQSDRYLDALKQASGRSQSGEYRLIYLSPQGEWPTEGSFTKEGRQRHQGKFIIGAWVTPLADTDEAQEAVRALRDASVARNSLDWLAECADKCRAENVRWFLRQFRTFVHNRLIREEEFSMTGDAIVDLALRSEDNLDAALRIGSELERIRDRVRGAILTNVQRRLGQWVLQSGGDWELNDTWPGGNWIETPSKKMAPDSPTKETMAQSGWSCVDC